MSSLKPSGKGNFQIDIRTDEAFQENLDESRKADMLLVVELYSNWCGPCLAVKPALQLLFYRDATEIPVVFLTVNIDSVLSSAKERTAPLPSVTSLNNDDGHPQQWNAMLTEYSGAVEPVFLFYRKAHLAARVEGAGLPDVLSSITEYTKLGYEPGTVDLGISEKVLNRAAFRIQTKWRRKQQLGRIGVYIDGDFYTHEEVAQRKAEEERKRREAAFLAKCNKNAAKIQAVWRGKATRKMFQQQHKALKHRKSFWMASQSHRRRAGKTVDKYDLAYLRSRGIKIAPAASTRRSHRSEPASGRSTGSTPRTGRTASGVQAKSGGGSARSSQSSRSKRAEVVGPGERSARSKGSAADSLPSPTSSNKKGSNPPPEGSNPPSEASARNGSEAGPPSDRPEPPRPSDEPPKPEEEQPKQEAQQQATAD